MIRLAVFIFAASLGANALAADAPPTLEKSLVNGMKFLMQQRNRDGSFGDESARPLATSRALLVFLQLGNVPDSGRYGTAVKDAEEWITKSILPTGAVAPGDVRTRAQAAAVLALAEVYGVESNPDRRAKVLSAIRSATGPLLALQTPTQNPPRPESGGWGDDRNTVPSLALTALAATALNCARDCGVAVPDVALDSARRYIAACRDGATGGFGPQPGKPPTVDSTATALVALDILSPAGDDNDIVASASAYLEKQPESGGTSLGFTAAAWVCWCDARLELPATTRLREAVTQRLMSIQQADGGWSAGGAKPDASTSPRIAVTELALIGMTAHFRSTPVLRH